MQVIFDALEKGACFETSGFQANIAVPRSLSPGIQALTDQAAPHHSHDRAHSAAAAVDNISVMRKKPISKQAAHPAAIPNSSETQPNKSDVNWKSLLPDSPAATGHPLLDAALHLNKSRGDSCLTLALMLCRQAPVADLTLHDSLLRQSQSAAA